MDFPIESHNWKKIRKKKKQQWYCLFLSWARAPESHFKVSCQNCHCVNVSVNSSCAQPPCRSYCGAFPCLVSPGGGAFANFTQPGGWAFANPGANPEFLTRTRFASRGFYWKNKQIGSFVKDGELKKFVKACSRFYACISSLLIKPELHSEIGSYRRV